MQCPKTWYDTDNRHMSREVYARVREQVLPHARVLNLQGLGEPMLSPLFGTMLDDAERHGLRVLFVTNTMFFKPGYVDRLVGLGAQITVSIDGACNETHLESRPGNDLDGVLSVLRSFRDARARQPGTGFELHINTVVTTRNVDQLEGILDLCIPLGISGYQLINPGVGPRTDEFARDAIGNEPDRLAARLPALVRKAETHGIRMSYPQFGSSGSPNSETTRKESVPAERPPRPAATRRGKSPFPGKCRDPWNSVYIDVDGWIRPCCRAIWIGMGNILLEPFERIWNNHEYRTLRRTIHGEGPPAFCRNCNTGWGITRGDERYIEKLEARGIRLPRPPRIGRIYPGMPEAPGAGDAVGAPPKTTPNRVGPAARKAAAAAPSDPSS
jgi:MoaA/NifB/PqqE/SkfB family radical SAM enzyme